MKGSHVYNSQFFGILTGATISTAVPDSWWTKAWDWLVDLCRPKLINDQTIALQLENVRMKLPMLYEREDAFFSMIEKRPVPMVSTRTARIPLRMNCE